MGERVEYSNQVHVLKRERNWLLERIGLTVGYRPLSPDEFDEYVDAIYQGYRDTLAEYGHEVDREDVTRQESRPSKTASIFFESDLDDENTLWGMVTKADARDPVGMSPRPDRVKTRFGIEGTDPEHADLYEEMAVYVDGLDGSIEDMNSYKRFSQPQGWCPW